MRKEVTQKQKDQWQKTREKGVTKYQERRKILYEVNKGAQKKNKEAKQILVKVHKKSRALKSVGTNPKKKYKLRKRTPKEAARYREYLRIRKIWFQDPANHICKLHMTEECREFGEPACDVHHTKGTIGNNLLDITTWLPGSRKCHRLIDEHTKEAIERGVVKSRHAK